MSVVKYTQTREGLYETDAHALIILADVDGWCVLDQGVSLADGIPTLSAAKRRATKLARAKRREPRVLLSAELVKAEAKLGLGVPGRDLDAWYSTKGLNHGVRIKREFAVEWRRTALAFVGKLTRRRMRVSTGHGRFRRSRAFTIFSVNGKDQLAVCPNAGPDFKSRLVKLEGAAFGNFCRRMRWTKER